MIGFILHVLLWLVIAFVALNAALRAAAWTGTGILQQREGQPYQVKLLHWLPRLVGWLRRSPVYEIVIGRTICVAGDHCWPELHAHAWKHVEQDQRYRGLENELYYVRALITGHGYSPDHWAEKEAIAFAKRYADEFAHLRAVPTSRTPLVPA